MRFGRRTRRWGPRRPRSSEPSPPSGSAPRGCGCRLPRPRARGAVVGDGLRAGRTAAGRTPGRAVLRRAPSLVRTLPVQLAEIMASLHRLDPQPVTDAVHRLAPARMSSTGSSWPAPPRCRGDRAPRRRRRPRRLAARIRRAGPPGDLSRRPAPLQRARRHRRAPLLDWTGALVADPPVDVAFTELLLADPPLPLGPARPRRGAAGRSWPAGSSPPTGEPTLSPSLAGLGWFGALHRPGCSSTTPGCVRPRRRRASPAAGRPRPPRPAPVGPAQACGGPYHGNPPLAMNSIRFRFWCFPPPP